MSVENSGFPPLTCVAVESRRQKKRPGTPKSWTTLLGDSILIESSMAPDFCDVFVTSRSKFSTTFVSIGTVTWSSWRTRSIGMISLEGLAYQNPGQISDLIKSEFWYFSLRGNTGIYSCDFAICNVRKWKLLQRSFQQAVARPSGIKTRTVMFPATENRLFVTYMRGFFSKSGDQFEKIHDQIEKFASHFSRKAVGLLIGPNTFELAPKIFACWAAGAWRTANNCTLAWPNNNISLWKVNNNHPNFSKMHGEEQASSNCYFRSSSPAGLHCRTGDSLDSCHNFFPMVTWKMYHNLESNSILSSTCYQLYPSSLNAQSFPNIFTWMENSLFHQCRSCSKLCAHNGHYASGTQSTFLLYEFRYPAAASEHRLGEGRQLLNSS